MPKIRHQTEADRERERALWGGSSEAAALFGLGYEDCPSAWSLWAMKTGKLDPPDFGDNDRVWFGTELESVIAKAVTRKFGWDLIEDRAHCVRPADPTKNADDAPGCERTRMAAHIDRWVREHEDGIGIVECKNRDWLQWRDNYTDTDASLRDRIQLAHQFLCCPEVEWGGVAVLVGGNELRWYPYRRADLADIMNDLDAAWARFWQQVRDDEEPALTGAELPAWAQVHGLDLDPEPRNFPPDVGAMVDEWVGEYLRASDIRKRAEKAEKEGKAKIATAMQDSTRGNSNAWWIKQKRSVVAAQIIKLPKPIRDDLEYANLVLRAGNGPGDQRATAAVEAAIAWEHVARKESVRVAFDFDPAPVSSDAPTKAADQEAFRKAEEFQAPTGDE